MNETFVEYSKDDIDDEQRRNDQRRRARQRALEGLSVSLECTRDSPRHAYVECGLADRVDGLPERHPGAQVERQGHGWELALVRHRQGADLRGVDRH